MEVVPNVVKVVIFQADNAYLLTLNALISIKRLKFVSAAILAIPYLMVFAKFQKWTVSIKSKNVMLTIKTIHV
jgi:hypothetical protein